MCRVVREGRRGDGEGGREVCQVVRERGEAGGLEVQNKYTIFVLLLFFSINDAKIPYVNAI